MVGGNRIDVLLNGDEIFPAKLKLIAGRLDEIFAQDLELSRRMTYEDWRRRGIVSRLLEMLAVPIKGQM